MHWEILEANPRHLSNLAARHLFLDFYENENGQTLCCWKDEDVGESSQEFDSEDSALESLRSDNIKWSRLVE
jgi:hypothetical protein